MADRVPVVIGLDLGTSGLKALALAEDGRVLARVKRSYPTFRPEPGAAEQLPQDWIDAVISALQELGSQTDPRQWCALGLSAMLPTLVCLDSANRAIGPAITWEDSRAKLQSEAFVGRVGAARLARLTGQCVDERYLLPMFARQTEQAGFDDAITTLAGAKDYLFSRLTGALLTDPSTASGSAAYDLTAGAWSAEILAVVGSPRVPSVVASTEHRPLLATIADLVGCPAGLPVSVGAADSVLGAYGLGVTDHGDTAYIAGTSTVILGVSDTFVLDAAERYLVTPMAVSGFGLEMDLLSTGAGLEWMARLFGLVGGAAELATLAGTAAVENSPLFLPYLAPGEQGALWDPGLTGVLQGATLQTSRAELARGLQAGLIVESRRCLAVLDEAFGGHSTNRGSGTGGTVRISGSSAASTSFRQDLADATGRAVSFHPGENDHSAIGAALLAGRSALGWSTTAPPPSGTIEPDAGRAQLWADRAERHDALRYATTHQTEPVKA